MNKRFTDLFINRPVLACVVSLLIFFVGLKSLDALNLRQWPKIDNTVVTISTAYPGANAAVLQSFITTR